MINFHSRMLKPWLSMSILAMVAALCFILVATTGASAHTANAHHTAYGLQQFTPHYSLRGGPGGGHSSGSHSSSSHATSSHDESSGNSSSNSNSSSGSYTHSSHPYYGSSNTSYSPGWLAFLIVIILIIIVISIVRRRRRTR
jgi:uncharacterized membrane protein